jgi:crotonobetainyl-CoA:carnitine CoA-transferase CaiB-like acyl-CoA transferase
MRIVGSPINLSETPGEVYAPAPLLGQHSEEILEKLLGYTKKDIEVLKKENVINRTV